ncbi:hypothetical protein N7462_002001 [Penicillium macrosclerotiorum]|uniref:uncharacterized protein n=1 Tax=Penicillium macrosclerotiorum TaxID=303699 RepID=UPI002547B2D6|nr:uncharacterized protein N7462_002001 [Penicillium macrosclerotiorum]KAJ5692578.1 hypothetical protein N7462_002001 [Penicillium macrosclerotiorum]
MTGVTSTSNRYRRGVMKGGQGGRAEWPIDNSIGAKIRSFGRENPRHLRSSVFHAGNSMECARQQASYATWRLQVFRQLLTASSPSSSLLSPRRGISSSRAQHRQSCDESHTRIHNIPNGEDTDTSSLPPSKQLPQSPLITHPRSVSKQRKKRPAPEDISDLSKNPWAVALASPVRLCSITAARLPRDLLGEWGLVRKPNTETNYILPVGLLKDSLQSPHSAHNSVPTSTITGQAQFQASNAADAADEAGDTPESEVSSMARSSPSKKPQRTLLFRIVAYLPLLRALTGPLTKSKKTRRPAITKILPFRWKHPLGPVTSRVERQLVWRSDMPQFMLQCMRGDVVRQLEKVSKMHRRLDAPNGVWRMLDVEDSSDIALEEALGRLEPVKRMAAGAILLLGAPESGTLAIRPDNNTISGSRAVFNTSTRSRIPVFDLSVLLGMSDLARLREAATPQFQNAALLFRPDDSQGVEAMLSLWRLQQFLRGEFLEPIHVIYKHSS